jgi:hypothetical protein
LLGSVMRIVLARPRWHRGVVKGSLHSRIIAHMGTGLSVLQTYPVHPGTVVFGAALPILFRNPALFCRF